MDPSGATFWELGVNRRMHVPLACVPLSAMSTAPAVKCLCDFGNTDGTKLQPTELSGECLQVRRTGRRAQGAAGQQRSWVVSGEQAQPRCCPSCSVARC